MKNKKTKARKTRNWGAVAAHFKTGAGPHGPNKGHKQKYCRRVKHKGKGDYEA